MFSSGAVDRILWMGVLCLVAWCLHHATKHNTIEHNTIEHLVILVFKGLTSRRLYKSFGVKGLNLRLKGNWLGLGIYIVSDFSVRSIAMDMRQS
jgi:hypothetical protein